MSYGLPEGIPLKMRSSRALRIPRAPRRLKGIAASRWNPTWLRILSTSTKKTLGSTSGTGFKGKIHRFVQVRWNEPLLFGLRLISNTRKNSSCTSTEEIFLSNWDLSRAPKVSSIDWGRLTNVNRFLSWEKKATKNSESPGLVTWKRNRGVWMNGT